jgi:VCBS repeat-containing protein
MWSGSFRRYVSAVAEHIGHFELDRDGLWQYRIGQRRDAFDVPFAGAGA